MKYCTNCGKKINEGADICLNCGKFVSKVPNNNTNKNPGITIAVIGMVLALLGFVITLIFALLIDSAKYEILGEDLFVKIVFSIMLILISLSPSVPGLILSLIGEKKEKSIYGIIGLIASIISILLNIALFIYLIY